MNKNTENVNKITQHMNICKELNYIYERKNHDYGDSFTETYNDLGLVSCLTRISDKFNRLKTLSKVKKTSVSDETIDDTLLDMANYCIMTYMCLHQQDNGKES